MMRIANLIARLTPTFDFGSYEMMQESFVIVTDTFDAATTNLLAARSIETPALLYAYHGPFKTEAEAQAYAKRHEFAGQIKRMVLMADSSD